MGAGPLPAGDEAGTIDQILELQRAYGNRAVVQLIEATDAGPAANIGTRSDQLARAVSVEGLRLKMDVDAAAAALTGLSSTDASAVVKSFEKRTGFGWHVVLKMARLGDDDRDRLQTLLQGSAMERLDTEPARKVGEVTGAVIGGLAQTFGVDVDPDVAAKVGGAVLEAHATATYEAERPANAKAVAIRRRAAQALEIHALMGRSEKERLFVLLGGSHADRMEIADQYSKEYKSSLYNDLSDKLKGKERERALALFTGDKRTAEAIALAVDTEKRQKLDADVVKFAPALKFTGDLPALQARQAQARERQEQRVEALASSGELEDVLARAGPGLEAVIEKDKILTFLRQGNVPETLAARLVRADREDKLTAGMLEESLRGLQDQARIEAYKQLQDSPMAPLAELASPLFIQAFYRRLDERFSWENNGRTLAKAIASTGDKARRERNLALLKSGGYLAAWEELDFALRAKPKDLDTVRRVLGGMTRREIHGDDPGEKDTARAGDAKKVEGLAAEYQRNTKRDLKADLMGTAAEQQFMQFWRGTEAEQEQAERQHWLRGGKFEATATDEAGRIAEEGRWLSGKLFEGERAVRGHRGAFARARDALGHFDKRMLDIAMRDASEAKNAMENALLKNPPDLVEAARQLEELRYVDRRVDANVEAYKQGTEEAFQEFESIVIEIVTAIGTGGESIAAKVLLSFAKNAALTIGTKMILEGHNYTPAEILADLRSAAGSALGAKWADKYAGKMAQDVASWAVKKGLSPKLKGATEWFAKQEIETGAGAVTGLATTGEISDIDPRSQGRSLVVGMGGQKVHAGAKRAYGAVRGGKRSRGGGPGARGGSEEEAGTRPTDGPSPRPAARGGPTPESPAPGAGAGPQHTGGEPGSGADAGPEPEVPVVPMALEEPARRGGRRPRGVPPPIPERALRPKKPGDRGKPDEGFEEGTGPREPDFAGEEKTQPDVAPAGDFEGPEHDTQTDLRALLDPSRGGGEATLPPPAPGEDRIRPPGKRAEGEPDAFPPQDWDHQLVIQLRDSANHGESRKLLVDMFQQDPTREVGMYRNTETGEYIVIQGEPATVGYVPKQGGKEQRWKEILENHSDVGRWELVTHTHPQGTPHPSGAPGDFGQIIREALNSRKARTSEILYPTDQGMKRTEFGFDPNHDQPYWYQVDGAPEPQRFATLDDYYRAINNTRPIPAWIPKGRVSWDNLGQIRQQMLLEDSSGANRPEEPPTGARPRGPEEGAELSPDPKQTAADDDERDPRTVPGYDLKAEPGRPASVPRHDVFEQRDWADYEILDRPKQGQSDSYRVRHKGSGKISLFKPTTGEQFVPRAQQRGVRKGEYASRSKATEMAAGRLGLETPKIELVRLGNRDGSLTEWVERQSLLDLREADLEAFNQLVKSPEFKKAQAGIDALDYLVNNLDRGQNFGNYLVELHPDGTLKSLAAIDHDLTFTSTGMRANLPDYTRPLPYEYSPPMQTKLQELSADRDAFIESIRPLVGDEAVPGVVRRLDEMLTDMRRKQARKVGRAMGR